MYYCPFSLDHLLLMSKKPDISVHLGVLVIDIACLCKSEFFGWKYSSYSWWSWTTRQLTGFSSCWIHPDPHNGLWWTILLLCEEGFLAPPEFVSRGLPSSLWNNKAGWHITLKDDWPLYCVNSKISEEDNTVHTACWMFPAKPLRKHRRMTALLSTEPTWAPAPHLGWCFSSTHGNKNKIATAPVIPICEWVGLCLYS